MKVDNSILPQGISWSLRSRNVAVGVAIGLRLIHPRSESGILNLTNEDVWIRKEKEIAVQLITLMAHIEGISAEQQFVPPVAVNVTDQDGKVWDFGYSPEWDSVDILHESPRLPVSLRLTDAKGKAIETEITDRTLRPEWIRRFPQ